MKPRVVLFAPVVLLLAACSSSGAETTTTAPSTTTIAPVATTSTSMASTSTTSTIARPVPSFPEYRIAERVVSPETGDTVVLLLDPTTYSTLSDLDLYEVIADAVDRFPPIFEAHVVDTQEAADAVLVEEPDEAQLEALRIGYFARLEEGFRIVYLVGGEESGTAVLGS